jgi:ATP-dependent RNA helicase RhlE
VPKERRTLLFSATLPEPIVALAGEMLKDPACLNIQRKSAPAAGITHSVYPVAHELKSHLLLSLLRQASAKSVLAFTRTKHRADRLADFLDRQGVPCARIHGNRSQAQRTEALTGFKRGRFRVLVATDVAARGIDVEALGLVVNFDVPHVPEDYIHRVGRTARASATGDAYTFVSPDEERDFRAIEYHLGKRLPRHQVADFDYAQRPAGKLEVPLAERIAAIRKRKAEERARAAAKGRGGAAPRPAGPADRRSGPGRGRTASPGQPSAGSRRVGPGLAWLQEANGRADSAPRAGRQYRRW